MCVKNIRVNLFIILFNLKQQKIKFIIRYFSIRKILLFKHIVFTLIFLKYFIKSGSFSKKLLGLYIHFLLAQKQDLKDEFQHHLYSN